MKNIKITAAALCLLTMVSCGTNQGTGTLVGAGGGAAIGALLGQIIGKNGKSTAIGAAIGGVVGSGAGALIGRHMDKVKAKVQSEVSNAKVEEITDANGLKAVKVTFDSGLQFALGKSTLNSAAKTDLNKFAKVLTADSQLSVDVQGYTDATGGDKINQPLSEKRAAAVAEYLAGKGVAASQFKNINGYGSQNPIVDAEVAPQNRRVEVYLYASQEMINSANNGTLQ